MNNAQQQVGRYLLDSKEPAALGVVFGFGYDDSQLQEKRHLTREDLDAVSKELPVVAIHQSGHLGALNSVALARAGITAGTPDPEGGEPVLSEDIMHRGSRSARAGRFQAVWHCPAPAPIRAPDWRCLPLQARAPA